MALAQSEDASEGGFTLKVVEESWEDYESGQTASIIFEASDWRLSGTWTEVMNGHEDGPSPFSVCVGSVRVVPVARAVRKPWCRYSALFGARSGARRPG